jgi:hypothetical protein
MNDNRKARMPRRRGLIAGVLLIALAVLSINAYATFTATMTVDQGAITAGHMEIAPGAVNTLTVGASGLAPGDTMERALDLDVDASTTSGIMTALRVAISADVSSALNTDATHGLKVWIGVCDDPWDEDTPNPTTYTCNGNEDDALGTEASPTAISTLGSATTLNNVDASPGASNHLMIKLFFPSTANDTFQDLSSELDFNFSGLQRAGTDK